MAEPDAVVDVVIGPGDVWFGGRDFRVRTLLGSCVAITVWHPYRMIGGMCHYMMPSRRRLSPQAGDRPRSPESGRYADEAVDLLMRQMYLAGTDPAEYEVKIFGGGNQFSEYAGDGVDVASRNVDAGLKLLVDRGLTPAAMDLGGRGHRLVFLDLWSGDVWVRHVRQEEPIRP